jgi:transcriptional regulator with XRE-family HTH domain
MTGAEFREARQRAGLSSRKAAAALGVAPSTVFMWEAGRSRIPFTAAEAIRRLAGDEMSAFRDLQIEQVAGIIADNGLLTVAYDERPGYDLAAFAAEHNPGGWEFETSAPHDGRLVHQGVVLSDAELVETVTLARLWLAHPEREYGLQDVRAGRFAAADLTSI